MGTTVLVSLQLGQLQEGIQVVKTLVLPACPRPALGAWSVDSHIWGGVETTLPHPVSQREGGPPGHDPAAEARTARTPAASWEEKGGGGEGGGAGGMATPTIRKAHSRHSQGGHGSGRALGTVSRVSHADTASHPTEEAGQTQLGLPPLQPHV